MDIKIGQIWKEKRNELDSKVVGVYTARQAEPVVELVLDSSDEHYWQFQTESELLRDFEFVRDGYKKERRS